MLRESEVVLSLLQMDQELENTAVYLKTLGRETVVVVNYMDDALWLRGVAMDESIGNKECAVGWMVNDSEGHLVVMVATTEGGLLKEKEELILMLMLMSSGTNELIICAQQLTCLTDHVQLIAIKSAEHLLQQLS